MRVLLVLAVLLVGTLSAYADPGLDLAILVDRSQSIARHGQLASATLRMSADVLARNARMYGVDHRIAVVSFASSPTIDLPWTSVRASARPHIEDRRPGGGTDILAVLQEVEKLFRSLSYDPSRRRAIVLLSDGVPYRRGIDMQRYAADLRRYVAAHFARTQVSIDVILLAQPNASRDALWQSLTDAVQHSDTELADVLATAHAVVTRLAGTPSVESTVSKTTPGIEHIVVPPYLEMIVFDVFRAPSGADVEVIPPDRDRAVRDGENGVEVVRLGEVLETLAVPRPRPGQWIMRKSRTDAHVRIRSQHFFPRGTLLQPDAAMLAVASDRIRIAYQVLDETERPLEELDEYPLTLNVTVVAPDRQKTTLSMEPDDSLGRTAFRTTDEANCRARGRYWTDVRVTTTDASGRHLEVFRDRWSGFTVEASPKPVQASAIARQSPAAAPTTASFPWRLVAIAIVLVVAGAIVRFRKTKAPASCLSDRSPQDER